MKKFLLIFFYFVVINISAQQNFTWFKINKYRVSTLSDTLRENSGLNFFKGKLFTFNDGGNPSEFFEIDNNSGKILNSFKINAENKDWEAITSDSTHIYIGDFGNNWGVRTDLKIYKILLDSSLKQNNLQKIQEVKFYYPEQNDFSKKPQNNNWDAESLVFNEGNLHIFTKEWQSYNTTHYLINPIDYTDNQRSIKVENYHLGYAATDAALFNGQLFIIGYTKKMEVYLTVFTNFKNGKFFNGEAKKFYIGQISNLGQIEGIAVNSDGIYISAEKFDFKFLKAPASFYFIPIADFLKVFQRN